MGKLFESGPELDNIRVYAVNILIHNYIPSDYKEPPDKYLDNKVCAQTLLDRRNDIRDSSPCIPQYRK